MRVPRPTAPPPADDVPDWIMWPIRALALVVVLPFRLLWEAVKLIGRLLHRFVLMPLAWLWQHLVVVPVTWLLRGIGTVLRILIGVPLVWLWREGLLPLLRLLHAYVLRPLGRAIGWVVSVVLEYLVVPVARFVYRWLLAPVGRAVVWFVRTGWAGTSWLGRQVYRLVLRPIGVAVAFVWRYTFGPVFAAVGVVLRWVRDEILRPAVAAARSVLEAVGVRR